MTTDIRRDSLPNFTLLNEQDLAALIATISFDLSPNCLYLDTRFGDSNRPFLMLEDGPKVVIGSETEIVLRSQMLEQPCMLLADAETAVRELYQVKVDQRKAAARAETQRKIDVVERVQDLVARMSRILSVDGGRELSEAEFYAMLKRVLGARDYDADAYDLYFQHQFDQLDAEGQRKRELFQLVSDRASALKLYHLEHQTDIDDAKFTEALEQVVINDAKLGKEAWLIYLETMTVPSAPAVAPVAAAVSAKATAEDDLTRPVVDRAATELAIVGTQTDSNRHPADGSTLGSN